MKIRQTIVLVAVVALAAAACAEGDDVTATTAAPATTAAAATTAAMPADPIDIGVIEMLTGFAGHYGQVLANAALLAVDDINAKGGLGGQPFNLKIEDNASENAPTVEMTRKLGTDPEVVAIIGPTYLANLIPGQEAANEIGVPYIAASGLVAPENQPWSFKNTMDYELQVKMSTRGILEALGATRVAAVIDKDNAAQVFTIGVVKEALDDMGLELVYEAEVTTDQPQYGPQIGGLQEAKPDAVLTLMSVEVAARFTKEARDRGFVVPWVSPNDGLADNRLLALSDGGAEGMLTSVTHDPTRPQVVAYKEAYINKHGGTVDPLSLYGWDMVYLLYHAMDNAGSLDRGDIREALENLDPAECTECLHQYINDGKHNFAILDLWFQILGPEGFVAWDVMPMVSAG
jgi:ABC-type branched-subunit amino acid transport system substrate-binding protein